MRTIWFFIRPYLGLIARRKGARLIKAAKEAVFEAHFGPIGDHDRRDCARFQAKTELSRAGVFVPDRILNGAIEAAVDHYKRRFEAEDDRRMRGE